MPQLPRSARSVGVLAATAALCVGGAARAASEGLEKILASNPIPAIQSRSPPVSAAALVGMLPEADASASRSGMPSAASSETAAPARWTASTALVGRSYRYSLQRGALDIGVDLAAPASSGRPQQEMRGPEPIIPFPSQLPAISVGLQRGAAATEVRGSLIERAMNPARSESFSGKVGVQWKPAESRVNFLREGLGLHLDGNDRMTVRLRKGVVGIYMQRKF